jgi:hypothetical protein
MRAAGGAEYYDTQMYGILPLTGVKPEKEPKRKGRKDRKGHLFALFAALFVPFAVNPSPQ